MDTNENNGTGRASYTEDERRELIEEFKTSGLTQAAFCRKRLELKKEAGCRFLLSFHTKERKTHDNQLSGIVGFNYEKTERTADTEIYYPRSSAKQQPCPQCRSWRTSLAETGKTRDIRGLCIGLKKR